MVKAKRYNPENRVGKPRMVCRVCLKDHPLRFCHKFLDMDYEERMRIISIYRHCAGCLSHDHTWRTCESEGRCKHCGDMHHTLLHKPGPRSSSQVVKKVAREQGPSTSKSYFKEASSKSRNTSRKGPSSSQVSIVRPRSPENRTKRAFRGSNKRKNENESHEVVPYSTRKAKKIQNSTSLRDEVIPTYHLQEAIMIRPTAIIKIICGERYINERALIDPGAECSIIEECVVRRMGQKVVRVGGKMKCLLQLRGNYGNSTTVETYAEVRRKHKIIAPKKSVDGKLADEFPGLQLADVMFHTSSPVHITLGCDLYAKIIRNGVSGGTFGKPLAQFTIFGYIISGSCTP